MRPGLAVSMIRCPLRWKGQVLSARRAGHDLDGWLIDCINRAVSHHRLAHGNGFIPDGLIFARLAQQKESGQKQGLTYSVRRRKEQRRVGKECFSYVRSRWSHYPDKKKNYTT